jgi:hypothetical protein
MPMKSPKTAGGVILLEGSGPFQPLICTGWRGSLIPGGELKLALTIDADPLREGEAERALVITDAV